MSVVTAGRSAATERARVTFGTTMRSEWRKLFSVPSTWQAALTTVVVAAGFVALLASLAETYAGDPAAVPTVVANGIVAGVSFSQLVVGILAVLIVSSEYTTGTIQPTLVANPRRTGVLLAKTLVAAVTGAVLALACWGLSAAVALPVYGAKGAAASLFDGPVLGALGGMAIYLVTIAVFGVFVATIIRNNAASIAVVVGCLFVLPLLGALLPESLDLGRFLLADSTQALSLAAYDGTTQVDVPGALITTLVWLVLTGAAAVVLFRKRDV